jgi:sucrose-6-phosphate hydrolase SacC (GH32 family)
MVTGETPLILDKDVDSTRRFLLIASAGLLMPRLLWAESLEGAVLSWRLQESGDEAHEDISGSSNAISSRNGHAHWVGSGRERALRLDGYSVWIHHASSSLPLTGGALTIAAWVALESYPVEEAAILQIEGQADAAIRFAIDGWGYLHFESKRGKDWSDSRSTRTVPKSKWVHMTVTCNESDTMLYLDGSPFGSGSTTKQPVQLGKKAEVTIGRSSDCPVIAAVFPTGVLNCLIKDVRVFDDALSRQSIIKVLEESKPRETPDLEINGQWCAKDRQRPAYHAMPPRAWTNEPHGLVFFEGQYHLFYQKNGNGPYWGHIHWGHMTSPDLYRWTEMPVALSPEPGPDSEGCWSGSVIEHEGKLALIYTGGDGHRSSICLALSTDGIHFEKLQGNPIIAAPPQGAKFSEFRDPFVWREGDVYYLIIGSAVKGVGGTALLYMSRDLIHWEYRKPLLVGDRETSGVFWEMPIFLKIGDQHALIVCEVPGRASYWVGTWKDETFTPMTLAPRRLELFNHLLSPTPYVHKEGRVITMGIIPDQRRPEETWKAGWAHLYSLPRVLSIDANGHLLQRPLEDIDNWSEPVASLKNIAIESGHLTSVNQASGTRLNLRVTFRRGDSQSISLLVRRSPDGQEQTEIRYEWEIGRLILDRSKSSLDPLVTQDIQEATFFPVKPDAININLFLDESVLEVFLDDRSAFATRIYPTLAGSDGVAFSCRGVGVVAESLIIGRINKPA